MVSFFRAAALALFAVAGVSAQDAAPQGKPDRLPCAPLDFVEKKADFATINMLVGLANGGILKSMLAGKADPLTITEKRLDAVPFSVLGNDFQLTPVVQRLDVKGLSDIKIRSVNITSPTNLDLGADFSAELSMEGTLRFEIAQVNKQWWQICWTNILQPKTCPPKIISTDVGIGLQKLGVGTNMKVEMLQCNKAAPGGTCKDLTVTDLFSALAPGGTDALLKRILLRLKDVSMSSLALQFDQITKLNFHFHSSGPLLTEFGQKLFKFTTTELNKKGDMYRNVINVSNQLFKTLVNKVIGDKLKPMFGAGCYDA
ncbi:hypothetical protein ATCC90586_011548 [Pythium insidiosum]|nr:hypothetical protein ATCC90586_011548 [Pythium insidiosum]